MLNHLFKNKVFIFQEYQARKNLAKFDEKNMFLIIYIMKILIKTVNMFRFKF